MRNRAKCKLCNSIIESFHSSDLVLCKCGEISIDGGPNVFKVSAKDLKNIIRIDDEGNEIIPKILEKGEAPPALFQEKPTKKDMLAMLDEMLKSIERLPQQALYAPVTQADFYSFGLLVSSILGAD